MGAFTRYMVSSFNSSIDNLRDKYKGANVRMPVDRALSLVADQETIARLKILGDLAAIDRYYSPFTCNVDVPVPDDLVAGANDLKTIKITLSMPRNKETTLMPKMPVLQLEGNEELVDELARKAYEELRANIASMKVRNLLHHLNNECNNLHMARYYLPALLGLAKMDPTFPTTGLEQLEKHGVPRNTMSVTPEVRQLISNASTWITTGLILSEPEYISQGDSAAWFCGTGAARKALDEDWNHIVNTPV